MPNRHGRKPLHHKKHSHKQKCDLSLSSSSSSSSCTSSAEGKNYIFAYNTTGFTYPNNTNFTTVPFDTVGVSDGWCLNIVGGNSLFTCPKTSVYEISYIANVRNRGTINAEGQLVVAVKQDIIFRLLRNSITVPGSNSWSTINVSDTLEAGYANGADGTNPQVKATFEEISNTILVCLNAGDVISLITAGTIFGTVSTLTLETGMRLLNLTGLEPAKISIVEIL